VIRRGERIPVAADAGTAVPRHETVDVAEHTCNGISVTVHCGTHEEVEVVPYS
jgi:hypothetical protein